MVTVEDGTLAGGAGSAVGEFLLREGIACRFASVGLPDRFVPQGKVPVLYRELGMDAQGIAEAFRRIRRKG